MQLRGHRRAALVVEVHVDEHRAAGEDVLWLAVRGVAGDGPGLEGADEEPAALGEEALPKADGTGATCRGCLGGPSLVTSHCVSCSGILVGAGGVVSRVCISSKSIPRGSQTVTDRQTVCLSVCDSQKALTFFKGLSF